ncbi:dethiobiotin synthase [Crateriforma conspicua]|uniref:dethiobiotin synthase n=1 Tax=Crateriforma conspicua TaxID=2527996 RepID=UPI0018CF0C63|nr:dethiobiotin synthase [Crateriforma conspicua]
MNPESEQRSQAKVWFIAGTDTDVGKTYVTALLAAALNGQGKRVGVYKPAASGCNRSGDELVADDAVQLWRAAGKPLDLDAVCPQRFEAALSPPESAKLAGQSVDQRLLVRGAEPWLRGEFDVVLIEGAGGLFSPISDQWMNIDLFQQFDDARLLVVAANRLGCVHQTLATCIAATERQVCPDGVVLCQTQDQRPASADSNAAAIARFGPTAVWGEIGFGASEIPEKLVRQVLGG